MAVSFIGRGNQRPAASHWQNLWERLELLSLVVIGIDCTGSCKSNYNMTMTTPSLIPEVHCKFSCLPMVIAWRLWNIVSHRTIFCTFFAIYMYNCTWDNVLQYMCNKTVVFIVLCILSHYLKSLTNISTLNSFVWQFQTFRLKSRMGGKLTTKSCVKIKLYMITIQIILKLSSYPISVPPFCVVFHKSTSRFG